jgi:predicted  nucleic acid-binding Zn-ribbon protein
VKYYLKRIMDEKIEKIAYEQAILWQKATEKNEHIKGLNKEMDRINTKYKKLTETLFAKMMRDTHKRSENDTDGERQVPWEGWTIEFSRQVWNYASLTAERWENNIPWRSRERQNSELGKIRINKELPELPPEAKLDKAGELLEIRMREIRERTEKIAQEDERLKLEEKRLELENAKLGIYKMAGRLGEFGDKMDRMEENYTTYDTDKKELKRDMTSVNRDCEQFVSELNNLAKEAEEHSIDLDKKDWYISLVRHTPPNFTYFEE